MFFRSPIRSWEEHCEFWSTQSQIQKVGEKPERKIIGNEWLKIIFIWKIDEESERSNVQKFELD